MTHNRKRRRLHRKVTRAVMMAAVLVALGSALHFELVLKLAENLVADVGGVRQQPDLALREVEMIRFGCGHECAMANAKEGEVIDVERKCDECLNRMGRDIKPPIIPTTCQCSLYDRDYLTDKHGNKWCTVCGNYKGHITDHK